ncbi:hypothetical protein SELMODRAFT_437591 [Selaginella moellendorffii]|uniref:Uncharacterized protein n=1 Tax=Selaginella moellendorffii TaxID=88036 RepID=D8QN91_SELML|nr:N-acetylglucosaminyl-phosphatidylinositol biosynthetic protein gpi1 [Selaginella moellendorffii]EFJ38063.1 hypothetical protein SELMODRAFT_437591 [Selaginella moellendorffii]|eukprot:XP_002960524.1 N-acetylglucosaminyl-phosphatidylinositol biosynthetic protein gpi1 [Selaginella moellendorffii]
MELCRIWWPPRLRQGGPLALLGWINLHRRCADLVVAAAVPAFDLEGFFTRRSLRALEECCGDVCVLGLCIANELEPRELAMPESRSKLWITCSCAAARDGFSTPTHCSITLEGKPCSPKVHFVLYNPPLFRSHHFSLQQWDFFPSCFRLQSFEPGNIDKKPYWILELEQQNRGPDIAMVTRQLNCAAFLDAATDKVSHSMFRDTFFIVLAGVAAILSSLYFAASRVWFLASNWILSMPLVSCALRSSSTFQSIQNRFQELSMWPSIFFWCTDGPQHPNAAVSHRLDLLRHSLWFKIAVDLVLGTVLGVLVLMFQNAIAMFVVTLSCFLTNDVLRTGCIWLMGVPAGFKLNNELAEVMGTAALNVTQAFLTFLELFPASVRLLQCLGAVSILLGASVSTSVMVDAVFMATAHITMLQRVTAFIYGNQLKVLAALWRMFRGRKFNPLRNRIDSYEYSVEELVVASLMFTPLLLLLPTMSVFYTFFTILHASLTVPRFLLQIAVELIKTFPYVELWQWIVARQRLPSGLEFHFEVVSNEVAVSRLHSRLATFDEITMPFILGLFSRWDSTVASSTAFNLATGGRLPMKFCSGLCPQTIHSSNLSLRKFFILSFRAFSSGTDFWK